VGGAGGWFARVVNQDALASLVADYDSYATQRKGFDDPADLMRLLRGAGLLEYRIAVRNSDPQGVSPDVLRAELEERGPRETESTVAAWFPINDLKQWYKEPEDLAALQANPVAYFAGGGQDLVAAEPRQLGFDPMRAALGAPAHQANVLQNLDVL